MAFGSFDSKGAGSHTVSEINMVPLIDVMLVLLVIFIITAPLLAHSIRIDLPRVSAEQLQQDPKAIDLAIKADGSLFWNDQPVTMDELDSRLAASSQDKPQPEIHIRADQDTRYEVLADVMGAARRAGMARIGFITTPAPPAQAAPDGQPQAEKARPAMDKAQIPAEKAQLPASKGQPPASNK